MKEVRDMVAQTRIVVEVNNSLKRFAEVEGTEGPAFKSLLLSYIERMLRGLALPGEVSIELRLIEDESRLILSPYALWINDERCRFLLPVTLLEDVSGRELARFVANAISQNCQLCLTASLVEDIWQQWSAEKESGFSAGPLPRDFHKLLLELIRRGFKIDRAKEAARLLAEKSPPAGSAEQAFEEIVAHWDAMSIRVYVSQAEQDLIRNAEIAEEQQPGAYSALVEQTFEKIQNDIFLVLGVMVPKVVIVTDETLEADEVFVQLNDLCYPLIYERGQNSILRNDATRNRVYFDVRTGAGNFLNLETVTYSLNLLRQQYSTLVETTLTHFDTTRLTGILRSLLDEDVSIKDLRSILEILVAINCAAPINLRKHIPFLPATITFCPAETEEEKNLQHLGREEYIDSLRMAFRRALCNKYLDNNILHVYMTSEQAEEKIKSSSEPSLEFVDYHQVISTISRGYEGLPQSAVPIILTDIGIRKRLRTMLNKEFPWLPVLSYHELVENLDVRQIALITFEKE